MSIQANKERIMNAFMKLKNKRLIIGGIIIILIAVGTVTYFQIRAAKASQVKAATRITTAQVTQGNITVDVSGTGSIVAQNPIDLVFSSTGKVAELNVNPGKAVTEGEILAKLDQINTLQMNVENKKLELDKAQKALDDLETNKDIKLADALLAQSKAAAALETAQKSELNKYSPRCSKEVTEQYYYDYMYAKHDFNYWNNAYVDGGTGYGTLYILQRRAPYLEQLNLGYANWKYCEGYSELEIQQSKANVDTADSDYQKAQKYYQTVKNNDGIEPEELALAQATKKNAQLQLDQAQRNLDGATLVSPIDGTVLTVSGSVNDTVNPLVDGKVTSSSFIELADLSKPVLQASFDETDLNNLNTLCTVQATFSSLGNKTYSGTITQINPQLVSSNSVSTAQAYISLNDTGSSQEFYLPIGLSATVKLSCNIAENALLVPLQALKKEDAGNALVYIRNADGTTESRTVKVGAKSASMAEVTGDLTVGDQVVTSTIK
jgi:RND family efflux transporter MFP subunit